MSCQPHRATPGQTNNSNNNNKTNKNNKQLSFRETATITNRVCAVSLSTKTSFHVPVCRLSRKHKATSPVSRPVFLRARLLEWAADSEGLVSAPTSHNSQVCRSLSSANKTHPLVWPIITPYHTFRTGGPSLSSTQWTVTPFTSARRGRQQWPK